MARNLVDHALRAVEEGNYQVTQVRGYNLRAVDYVKRHAEKLKNEYASDTFVAVSGRQGRVVAYGKNIDELLSAVGGLKKLQFPNPQEVMVGKVKDLVLAQRRFSKHLDYLGMLDQAQFMRRRHC